MHTFDNANYKSAFISQYPSRIARQNFFWCWEAYRVLSKASPESQPLGSPSSPLIIPTSKTTPVTPFYILTFGITRSKCMTFLIAIEPSDGGNFILNQRLFYLVHPTRWFHVQVYVSFYRAFNLVLRYEEMIHVYTDEKEYYYFGDVTKLAVSSLWYIWSLKIWKFDIWSDWSSMFDQEDTCLESVFSP